MTETAFQEPVNPLYAYTGAFVDELERAGVRNVVICPGSRSTPLAMAFAAQHAIQVWMHGEAVTPSGGAALLIGNGGRELPARAGRGKAIACSFARFDGRPPARTA